jgi:regulatory protein
MEQKPAKRERKPPKKISKTYLENAALYYLQRYATSSENLKRVLLRKVKRSCSFHEMEVDTFIPLVEDLVTRYTASGLLDDKTFAAARVTSLRRQGLSTRAILAKLQMKGLSAKQIETALKSIDEEKDNPELAAAVAYAKRKKLGPFRTKAPDPQKELAALGRAGFSFDIAKQVLNIDLSEDI